MTNRTKTNGQFDVLRDILDTLRFKGTMFFHSDMAAPWGVSFEPIDFPRFHIALAGCCYVGVAQDKSVAFKDMEIVMLPNGSAHWIADQPGRALVAGSSAAQACELGAAMFQEGEITNRLMCGMVQFDQGMSHPLVHALPQFLHFTQPRINESAWATTQLLDSEIKRLNSNNNPIIDRLAEVLFIQLLEEHIRRGEEKTGFFAALGDPRLMQALKLIHQEARINWSLDSLGSQVGMSRTTLNRHFQNTIGVSAMSYIQDWKMTKAYSLIKNTHSSIDQIADQVGFSSARTLSKAFNRQFSTTPSQVRNKTDKA